MKKLAILAVLGAGLYVITKKDATNKEVVQVVPGPNANGVKPNSSFRPNTPASSTTPILPNNPSTSINQFSEIPSPNGAKIDVEGGTLDLAADLIGYKSYEQVGANWQPKIPRVPQYIGSLEGKILVTEHNDLYVIIEGFSYQTVVIDSIEKWGKLYPEDAIPVRNVPMWFKDKYPQKGIFIVDFSKPILT